MFSQVSEDKISGLLESKCTVARSVKKFRYFLGDDSRFEDVPKEKLNEKRETETVLCFHLQKFRGTFEECKH
jgi:hypothetical protein